MSNVLSFHDALMNLVALRNETTDPNATVGFDADDEGSFFVRNGTYPTAPVETYLKLNDSSGFGWTKQNTVNMQVFNVMHFGAVADGVTSCNVAINAAIAAANLVGGGEIYFPPGDYAIYYEGGQLSPIRINNMSNLHFRGDGYASILRMRGNTGGGAFYMFLVNNQSHDISFSNLHYIGVDFTNGAAAGQYFFIQVSSIAPGDLGPPHDIDVVGNWFDFMLLGAAIRILGDVNGLLSPFNIRLYVNSYVTGDGTATYARSCVEGQRYSTKVEQHFSWFNGAKNSLLDFEPGGGQPQDWQITGNHFLYNAASPTVSVDLSGAGSSATLIALRPTFAYNVMVGPGNLRAVDATNLDWHGNIVVMDPLSPTAEGVIYLEGPTENFRLSGNILISQDTTGDRPAIDLFGKAGPLPPATGIISDNIAACALLGSGGATAAGFELTSFNQASIYGNLLFVSSVASNSMAGIMERSTLLVGENWMCWGNVVVGTTNPLKACILIATGGNFDIAGGLVNDNFGRNAVSGIQYETSAGKVFTGFRACHGNNMAAVTSATVNLPTTNVGSTFEADAAPGPQIASVALAAGPNTVVSAPVGSLCANPSGSAATALWYKESGAAATGWLAVAASYIQFGTVSGTTATAQRFLAPGYLLATETTVEIQVPITRDGRIRNWRLVCVAGTGGGTNTYTIRKNAVTQSGSIAIANTATSGSNAASFAVAKGDLISVSVTKSVAPATPQTNIFVSMELV